MNATPTAADKIKAEAEAKKASLEAKELAAKAQADEAAKAEKAEAARIEAEQAKLEQEAEEERQRILKSDEGASTDNNEHGLISKGVDTNGTVDWSVGGVFASPPDLAQEEKLARGRAAAAKIKLIAMDFPPTTPDEHVVFGRAGHKVTVGDLRDVTGIR